jgi:hypothetical protein
MSLTDYKAMLITDALIKAGVRAQYLHPGYYGQGMTNMYFTRHVSVEAASDAIRREIGMVWMGSGPPPVVRLYSHKLKNDSEPSIVAQLAPWGFR